MSDAARADAEPGAQLLVSRSNQSAAIAPLPTDADRILVATYRDTPNRLERRLSDHGIDPRTVTVIPVSGTDLDYAGPLTVTDRVAPSDLTGLGIRLSNTIDDLHAGDWLYVRGLSAALMYVTSDRLYRFLDFLTRAARERDLRGAYEFYRPALSDTVHARFRTLFDDELATTLAP
ncbi:hypothetical protein [Salarchaeum sp. JOR-1]|uniref:DUF7504 family protein n=1 Tax=Salarchaeum sp. JOR-1 TaxID=2599399 RepID=UPI0011983102|nr:hypothetical protein [Salarchaeum sp. JOR-1]QDX40366.1 hypothetical protein FQU85_05435 [Salarchaeum sp. JOR-1]